MSSPEDMRRNQHLITNDVKKYMTEYEVSRFTYAIFFPDRQQELNSAHAI